MMGLERETIIFIYAMITGISAKCMYDIFYLFRGLVRHAEWVIGMEDLFYWIATAIYFFIAMFNTTYGGVRWFFILGIVCGVFLEQKLKIELKKVLDKIVKRI